MVKKERKHYDAAFKEKVVLEAMKEQKTLSQKVYPYLLKNRKITKPNQVWSTDITYIPKEKGFSYLVAIIDWYSRFVLSWRLSNSFYLDFCVQCLEDALSLWGTT